MKWRIRPENCQKSFSDNKNGEKSTFSEKNIALPVTFFRYNRLLIERTMKKLSFRDDVLPLKNKIFRLALRVTLNKAEAEDIVQDVLIRVWNKRDELGEVDSIEAYSLTVCKNLALDRIARKETSNVALDDAPQMLSNEASPDQQLMQSERLRMVEKFFNTLPEQQRMVMHLRDIEGKSYKEIAGITGQSEELVKVNLFRARQRIRQQIEKIEAYGL